MPISALSTIYAISLGANNLGGILSQSFPLNSDVQAPLTDGQANPKLAAMYSQKPVGSFSTLAIASALPIIGVSGVDISTLTGGVSQYAQANVQGATRNTTGKKYNAVAGIVVPKRLSVSGQGDATLEVDIYAISTGGNAPVVVTDSVTLPTTVAGDLERFGIGTVKIGGITLTQVNRIDVDFGISVEVANAGGECYATWANVKSQTPTITISGNSLAWLAASGAVPTTGLGATQSNTTIFLRKRAANGIYVADATASHISLTMAGMLTISEAGSGSGVEPMECTATLKGIADGTNAIIVYNAATAIS